MLKSSQHSIVAGMLKRQELRLSPAGHSFDGRGVRNVVPKQIEDMRKAHQLAGLGELDLSAWSCKVGRGEGTTLQFKG
jgi:hypothetical protein